jgi:guanosine-3',5'-bis(diphosphate) 3'-pyrophosphohydrolase
VEELEIEYGQDVAAGVLALTKNLNLPKLDGMKDSLERIKRLRKEAWAVKLADRITNLQQPPVHWTISKKMEYQQEAMIILQELKGGNLYLENRLESKILEYAKYIEG